MIYDVTGASLSNAYDANGERLQYAYDVNGGLIYYEDLHPLPIPTGVLSANNQIVLPDLYESGKGFTCTGLAWDSVNEIYLVGDIGILLPNSGTIQSQIVKISEDFATVLGTIKLYELFPSMGDVQGITIDTSDNTIWFCSPSENLIRHINSNGLSLGSFQINRPTGISYDDLTNTLWICTYEQKIINVNKSGATLSTFLWSGTDTLDQCFVDGARRVLYFDAGDHYSSANYLYAYDINAETVSITCTLTDSYSVEGISLQEDKLVIANDGYYHSATDNRNLANIYLLS